jgi:hypothetical protein
MFREARFYFTKIQDFLGGFLKYPFNLPNLNPGVRPCMIGSAHSVGILMVLGPFDG